MNNSSLSAFLVVLVSALLFYSVISNPMSTHLKVVLSLLVLIATTYVLKGLFHFDTEMGLILIKTKVGLDIIHSFFDISIQFYINLIPRFTF